jgi:ribonuclease BN (tRNA processing enzyme)
VDAAFLEGMFLPEDQEEAEEKMHMTVAEAAQVAANAAARLAVLVHISPRYVEEVWKSSRAVRNSSRLRSAGLGSIYCGEKFQDVVSYFGPRSA